MTVSTEVAAVLFTIGIAVLYVEFAFPKIAQSIGLESSRASRICGALFCMAFALYSAGAFRGAGEHYVLPLLLVGGVAALTHEIITYCRKNAPKSPEPPKPISEAESRSDKK